MGTYYIPRNVKGETRILYIFTIKALITTGAGAMIGVIFYFIFSIHLHASSIHVWHSFCMHLPSS